MAAASATGQSEGGAPSPGRARGASGHEAGSAPLEGAAPPAPLTVTVVNTLSWRAFRARHAAGGLSRAGDRVLVDDTPAASQRLQDGRLAVWLDQVPPLSSVRLRLVPGPAASPVQRAAATERALENVPGPARRGRRRRRHRTASRGPAHRVTSSRRAHRPVAGTLRERPRSGRGRGEHGRHAHGGRRRAARGHGAYRRPCRRARSAMRRFRVVAGSDLVLAEIALDKLSVRRQGERARRVPVQRARRCDFAPTRARRSSRSARPAAGSCRDFIGVQSAMTCRDRRCGVSLVSLDATARRNGRPHRRAAAQRPGAELARGRGTGNHPVRLPVQHTTGTPTTRPTRPGVVVPVVIAPPRGVRPRRAPADERRAGLPLLVIAGGEHDAPGDGPVRARGRPGARVLAWLVELDRPRWSGSTTRRHDPADLVVRSTRPTRGWPGWPARSPPHLSCGDAAAAPHARTVTLHHAERETPMRYRVHRLEVNREDASGNVERFLNQLRGPVLSIVPYVVRYSGRWAPLEGPLLLVV